MTLGSIRSSVAAASMAFFALSLAGAASGAESRLQLRQMDLGIQSRALDRQRSESYRDSTRGLVQERALYRQLKRNERTARRNEPAPTDRVSQRLYQHLPPLGHVGDEIAIQADRLDPPRPSSLPYLSNVGVTHAAPAYDHISRNTR